MFFYGKDNVSAHSPQPTAHSPQPTAHSPQPTGFTLIELVMVILLLSVLAAVAIPNFIDMRVDAKNAATKGALGALRSAITIVRAAIALKESPNSTPKYPVVSELWENKFKSQSHPVLSGVNIMDPSTGIPKNPWTTSTTAIVFHNTVISVMDQCADITITTRLNAYASDCVAASGGNSSNGGYGWVYSETKGEIWAGSNNNGGADVNTGTGYDIDCNLSPQAEWCF